MAETAVRVRVVFDDRRMLSKSKKKDGLKRCWLLLKPQLNTISDLTSHLQNVFSLHRTCPDGITLSMDGFILPPFESTCILKDKDIVCVKRKGSMLAGNKPAMLPSTPHAHLSIELPKLLAIEGFQEEEAGGFETVSEEDNNDQLEDAVYEETTLDEGNVITKKRKASNKQKSPSQKKTKLSSPEKLAVSPEVHEEGLSHHKLSASKKDKDKSLNSSSQLNKSSNLDLLKQSNDKSEPQQDEKRLLQPQGDAGTKKTPSRSARRKKAKRKWLREQLKLEKEKLHPSTVLEKDGQNSPVKNINCIVSDVPQQSDEESEAEDDMVPVEIRPGHIRFQPLRKDQAAPENRFPVETCQWNGITSKKKGQKWGKERTSSRKMDVYEHSSQECPSVQNAEKKHTFNAIDFDKLTPYRISPKEGDVIAYRLIELSASWTPELSSFRVGKVMRYDAESNRISLEPVLEFPFEFKKIDEDDSSVQFDPFPYGEDGSLEIEYSSVADVRIVNHGNLDSTTIVASSNTSFNPAKATNSSIDRLVGNQTAVGSREPENGGHTPAKPENGGHTPAKENGKVNVWDEINEALMAKKAKLSQKAGWRKEESSGTQSWSNRTLRCSALGPTMALLRSRNGL